MKKILTIPAVAIIFLAACSSEPKPAEPTLTPTEEQAVEERMKQDQAAMDSLEKALMEKISAEINVE